MLCSIIQIHFFILSASVLHELLIRINKGVSDEANKPSRYLTVEKRLLDISGLICKSIVQLMDLLLVDYFLNFTPPPPCESVFLPDLCSDHFTTKKDVWKGQEARQVGNPLGAVFKTRFKYRQPVIYINDLATSPRFLNSNKMVSSTAYSELCKLFSRLKKFAP